MPSQSDCDIAMLSLTTKSMLVCESHPQEHNEKGVVKVTLQTTLQKQARFLHHILYGRYGVKGRASQCFEDICH